jgi:MYXO-CTERM domain-containing protein
MTRTLLWAVAGAVVLLPTQAWAEITPGDTVAAVLETGDVYVINGGGDFSVATPAASVAPLFAYDVCRTQTGNVLVVGVDANLSQSVVYDVTTGTAVPFATGLQLAVGLHCGAGQIFVTDYFTGVFDITAGGNFANATPYATGISSVSVFRDANGTLWSSDYDDMMISPPPYGVVNITTGGDFSNATPYALAPDGDAADIAQHAGALYTSLYTNGVVVDFTAGGTLGSAPPFATLPGVLGLAARDGTFLAGTQTGTVFEISTGGDFSAATPFVTGLGGVIYGLEIGTNCGNAVVDFGEPCDGGGETATCDPDCTAPVCGDGVLNMSAGEACDAATDTAACDDDCTLPLCGDAHQNAAAGEQCDDGNAMSGDGCSASCQDEGAGGGGGGGAGPGGGGPGGGGSGPGPGGGGPGPGGGGPGPGGGGPGGAGGEGASQPSGGSGGSNDDDDRRVDSGCGCRVPGRASDDAAPWLLAGVIALASRRRRRA